MNVVDIQFLCSFVTVKLAYSTIAVGIARSPAGTHI